jgi:hypothetical protein
MLTVEGVIPKKSAISLVPLPFALCKTVCNRTAYLNLICTADKSYSIKSLPSAFNFGITSLRGKRTGTGFWTGQRIREEAVFMEKQARPDTVLFEVPAVVLVFKPDEGYVRYRAGTG